MSICEDASYTCGEKKSAVTSTSGNTGINTNVTRNIDFTVGSTKISMQERKRTYAYTDAETWSSAGFRYIYADNAYFPCGDVSTTFGSTFSEDYATLDTELLYLDLRNDTVVTRETKESLKLTDADNKAPDNYVSVFTGYDSTSLHPYVFETAPISRDITFNLYLKGIKTELHTEHIDAGYGDDINLLMPVAPNPGAFGWKINGPAWAIDLPWYIQPSHKEEDGNEWLFWPPWLRAIGTTNTELDENNRDRVYEFRNGGSLNTAASTPNITESLLKGSIAFDVTGNTFYSLAIPSNSQLTNPAYLYKVKLIVDGKEVVIPKEMIQDRVGNPQEKNQDGSLKWTDPKESEHDVWYPIAPL